jgi:hypothetical protein
MEKIMSKINRRAFELGAQCRRAGLSEERMLTYYAHERNHPDYNPRDMVDGWNWQGQQYLVYKGDKS